MKEIVTTARDLEKESILFCIGMKEMVPKQLGRGRIERIMEEEKSHLVTLTEELINLK